ncbi:hypothetical protein [Mesorhizobium sp. L103C131B0]|uniref:hypothetical protein n=1 Tax=Mesorhizobium sp. L103C131B0 TaxID=1287089 RepID=UPI0004071878|nr:hypothetical protein [Mesorhizobium sp. L103C131B0]
MQALYQLMSTRGADFLHKLILNKVPDTVGAGVISIAELTQELSPMLKRSASKRQRSR